MSLNDISSGRCRIGPCALRVAVHRTMHARAGGARAGGEWRDGCALLEGGRALGVSGLTVMEVSVGAGELGSSAGGSLVQEGQAAVSTSGVSASEDMTDEVRQ